MEDNKEKQTTTEANNQPENQPQPAPADFGSAGMDDINKNVGHFGNTTVQPQAPSTPDLKLDVDAKVVEKASKEEINFERFSKTKKERKHFDSAPKTRFGEKVAMMLRTKKGLTTTWILEILIWVLVMGAAIGLIVWINPYRSTPMIKTICGAATTAGIVFFWISIFPCVIPLIYLVTTWFIGINQVASSKNFHLFFWLACLISLVCFILGISLCANAIHLINRGTPQALINLVQNLI